MKSIISFINKYLFIVILIINGIITYHKISFFNPESALSRPYIIVLFIVLISSIVAGDKAWHAYLKWIILWGHTLFHGVFLLTFPMGIVFALIGSYILALKVLVFFYLPSALALLFNIYMIKTMRH